MRHLILGLGAVLLVAASGPARAQGPSFDCRDAGTPTEIAICASAELSAIEEDMADAYEGLAARIGASDARAAADVLLARREACGADAACIRDRLLTSMALFLSQGREDALSEPPASGSTPPAVAVAPLDQAPPPAPAPLSPIAAAPVPAVPIAAAPFPAAPADPASPAIAADTVLGRSFLALAPHERSNVQGRLFEAGFLAAPITGQWDAATEAAILRFLIAAEREGGRFEVGTEAEAHLVYEIIDSDAFERRFLGETVPDAFGW